MNNKAPNTQGGRMFRRLNGVLRNANAVYAHKEGAVSRPFF
jgi:hypothetical protein